MKLRCLSKSVELTARVARINPVRGLVLLAVLWVSVTSGMAATAWDADTSTSGARDGGGTWDASTANWWNGSSDIVWPNTATSVASIGAGSGTAGTITVSGTVILNAIQFAAAGSGQYTLTNGTLAFGGTTPTISIPSGNVTPTIQSALVDNDSPTPITFALGSGTLNLGTNNTYSGQTTISGSAGTLKVGSMNNVANPLASSSLGRPVSAANGTVTFGTGVPCTLIYTGPHCHPVERGNKRLNDLKTMRILCFGDVSDMNFVCDFSAAATVPNCRNARRKNDFCSSHRVDSSRTISPLRPTLPRQPLDS
jgi:autotransporter-associated beta strand protein